jgi:hypothetical protein
MGIGFLSEYGCIVMASCGAIKLIGCAIRLVLNEEIILMKQK